jgi:hypothetical protein
MFRQSIRTMLLFTGMFTTMTTARSDEGMWLLNETPKALLKERYNFDLTDAWLEKAVRASVRFNNGGSGGFVSPNGLIVTNHHIAADALQKLSSLKEDLFALGFYAKTKADERKCPDLELNVLQSIEDVTARVNAAVKPVATPAEAAAARRAILGEIEKESLEKTGFRSDVVTLYQGGAYHLYRYKKYTDVRLVFAPEAAIASFGMLLRGSRHAGSGTLSEVAAIAGGALGPDAGGYRAEFLDLVRRAQQLGGRPRD